jgi:hypothetical protein
MTAGILEASRSVRQVATSAIVTLLLAAVSSIIAAQVFAQEADDLPPRDVYHERGRSTGDKIAFCVNPASMMAPFEMALAREIAARLLVTPNVIEVKTWHPTEPLDYRLPLAYDELYIEFAERCGRLSWSPRIRGARRVPVLFDRLILAGPPAGAHCGRSRSLSAGSVRRESRTANDTRLAAAGFDHLNRGDAGVYHAWSEQYGVCPHKH